MKILIVDDMMIFRKIIVTAIGGEYETVEAEGGHVALKILNESDDIKLILLDWTMADVDGLTLLKKIRQTNKLAKIPVIMVTGKNCTGDVMEAIKNGANDYVVKPIEKSSLLEKIDKLLK